MKFLRKKIKLLRQKQGWNQNDVADHLQLSTPAYSKIETGITDVNIPRLEQIASLFNVSVIELLTDEEHLQTTESHLRPLKERLKELDLKVIELQRKMIELYEEIQRAQCFIGA